MNSFEGKAAFVTGGASGIGLALARALAEAGTRVMIADIEEEALGKAVASLQGNLAEVRGVVCDVASAESVGRAAKAAIDAFGKIHVVCNNAGVGGSAGAENVSLEDWRWVIDVNLMGVVHGVKTFVPHIKSHGEGGHIVNTASMAGFLGIGTGFGAYTATKYAVVGISEALAMELAPQNIGVSVLCPGWVNTKIIDSRRNWPKEYGEPPARTLGPLADRIAELVRTGMEPADVAALVMQAIRDGQFYVFTHPHMRPPLEERFKNVLADYRKLGPAPGEKAP